MTSGDDVSEYLGTLGLLKSYLFKFFKKKSRKNREKKNVLVLPRPQRTVSQVICLFPGLFTNPDMSLSLLVLMNVCSQSEVKWTFPVGQFCFHNTSSLVS